MRLVLSFVLVWAIAYFKPSARGSYLDRQEMNYIYNPQRKIDFIGCGQRPLAPFNGALEVEQITSHAQEAIPHSHPSLCSIRHTDDPNLHLCIGVLVKNLEGKYYLITAYTCVRQIFHEFDAFCGVYNRVECEPQVVKVNFKRLYTNYYDNDVPKCDIAILELTTQLPYNLYISAACLPNEDWFEGEKGLYASWWNTSTSDESVRKLQQFPTRTITRDRCRDFYDEHDRITENRLCSSLPLSGFKPCDFVRGAPLFTYRENRWTLTGIGNWIPDCADPDLPIIYTDIFAVKEWIDTYINDI